MMNFEYEGVLRVFQHRFILHLCSELGVLSGSPLLAVFSRLVMSVGLLVGVNSFLIFWGSGPFLVSESLGRDLFVGILMLNLLALRTNVFPKLTSVD